MLIWTRLPAVCRWVPPITAFLPPLAFASLVATLGIAGGVGGERSLAAGSVAGGMLLLGSALWRAVRTHRCRCREANEHVEARRESAIRRFWQASADFSKGAWARREVTSLLFLCQNLDLEQPLGEGLAKRLRFATANLRGRVLERLADVVSSAREAGLSEDLSQQLFAAWNLLDQRLSECLCRAGEPPHLDTKVLASALGQIIERTEELREEIRPRIAADLAPTLRWLVQAEHGTRLEAGGIEFQLDGSDGRSRIAVRPFDLVACLTQLLGLIFRRGQIEGPLAITGADEGESYRLYLDWRVRDRWHVEPATLLEALRPLTQYGARLSVEEDLEGERMRLEARFPRLGEGALPREFPQAGSA